MALSGCRCDLIIRKCLSKMNPQIPRGFGPGTRGQGVKAEGPSSHVAGHMLHPPGEVLGPSLQDGPGRAPRRGRMRLLLLSQDWSPLPSLLWGEHVHESE